MKNLYDVLRKKNACFTSTSVNDIAFNDAKILNIRFWYKGCSYIAEGNDAQEIYDYVLKVFHQHSEEYKNDTKFFIDQLDELIKFGYELKNNDPLWFSVFALNVFCLTKLGIIKDDEYNGMQYIYE
jgi:hypothetical protein